MNSTEILVTSELSVRPDLLDEFLAWMRSGLSDSRTADGNLSFDVATDPETPGRVLVVERWASEAQQQRYMTWRRDRGDLDGLRAFLIAPPAVRLWR